MTDLEKLRVLLPHWIEHNHSHVAEFTKWAGLVKAGDNRQIARLIEEAIDHLQKADRVLDLALERLGGPLDHQH